MPGFWQPRITSVKKIVPRRPSMRYAASENEMSNDLAAKSNPRSYAAENGYKPDATQISRIAGRSHIKGQTARHYFGK
jgi:hypothetical protein